MWKFRNTFISKINFFDFLIFLLTPSIQVNVTNLPPFALNNKKFYANKYTSATVHLIFLVNTRPEFYIPQLQKVMRQILNTRNYLTEIKCLVVLYERSNSLGSIEKILFLAEQHLLPNFGVLQVVLGKKSQVFTKNFASGKTEIQSWNSKCFPNKMRDLSGKSVRVGVIDSWPNGYVKNYGLPMHLIPQLRMFKVYQLAAEFSNFTSVFVELKRYDKRPHQSILVFDDLIMLITDIMLKCTFENGGGTIYIYSFDKIAVFAEPMLHYNL